MRSGDGKLSFSVQYETRVFSLKAVMDVKALVKSAQARHSCVKWSAGAMGQHVGVMTVAATRAFVWEAWMRGRGASPWAAAGVEKQRPRRCGSARVSRRGCC